MPRDTAAKRRRTSTPKRSRAQALSEADIIAAALELVRRDGVEALGMRGLAQELGVSPMAIYYYVPNKDELLSRVAGSLLERVPLPPASPARWDAQLRALAMAAWELFSEYPGLSRSVMERPPMKATRRHNAYALSLFAAAGLGERAAFDCLLTFHTFMAGVLSAHSRIPAKAGGAHGSARGPASKEAKQLASYMNRLSSREWMSFGLEVLLDGIRAAAKRGR